VSAPKGHHYLIKKVRRWRIVSARIYAQELRHAVKYNKPWKFAAVDANVPLKGVA
jgi:hypothetical protein